MQLTEYDDTNLSGTLSWEIWNNEKVDISDFDDNVIMIASVANICSLSHKPH